MKRDTRNVIILSILFVLSVWAIVANAYSIAITKEIKLATANSLITLSYMFLIYYFESGYNKPHSNLLRYAMLIYCGTLVVTIAVFPETNGFLVAYRAFIIMLAAYVSGRLNKEYQNKYLMPLILALSLALDIINLKTVPIQTFVLWPLSFGGTIEWLVIYVSYLVRYKEHKEAGEIADNE